MTDTIRSTDAAVEALMAAESVPGAAVAVVAGGEVVFERGYGLADLAAGRPVTPDTVFGIGSLGKSFTAVAIAQLVAEGRLAFNTSAVELLPELRLPEPFPTREITVEHLLSHTSGLPVLPVLEMSLGWRTGDDPMEGYDDLIRYLATMAERPAGHPGERFSYSNDSYALLGTIVERLSGMSYAEYLESRVFAPLGMTRSTLADPTSLGWEDVTSLYDYEVGQPAYRPDWPASAIVAPAGLHRSTARDMARYLIAHLGGFPGVPEDLREELYRPRVWRDAESGYALGWGVFPTFRGELALAHSGGITGVSSHAILLPGRRAGVIALLNVSGGPAREIAEATLTEVLRLPPAAEPPTYDPTPAELARAAGRYRYGRDAVLVQHDGDGLAMRVGDRPAVSLVPARPGEFRATLDRRVVPVVFPGDE
ncbi:MAG TPA: serine hydrolase, partial [Thermomicrobiales bacterium]|nr:serine hydrolase [Thermomicrobiales bacterium]